MKKVILGLAFVAFAASSFAGTNEPKKDGEKATCHKEGKACCKKSGKSCEKKAEDKKEEKKS